MMNYLRTTERITETIVPRDDEMQWIFVYFLQTITTERDEQFYALRVDKLSRDGVLLEREETCAFTDCRLEALAMANAFARGTVPPCVLLEMADEWAMQRSNAHTYHMAG
ncbi:MAG: hypothetical protein FWC71_01775 [Defluviitaleaceae bacterium]|nr:hypothetical protein [Defluviitaleaceae bacterium]